MQGRPPARPAVLTTTETPLMIDNSWAVNIIWTHCAAAIARFNQWFKWVLHTTYSYWKRREAKIVNKPLRVTILRIWTCILTYLFVPIFSLMRYMSVIFISFFFLPVQMEANWFFKKLDRKIEQFSIVQGKKRLNFNDSRCSELLIWLFIETVFYLLSILCVKWPICS